MPKSKKVKYNTKWNGYVVDILIYVFTIDSVRSVGVGRFVPFPFLPAGNTQNKHSIIFYINNNDIIFRKEIIIFVFRLIR